MNIKVKNITIADVMSKKIHRVFVRESGPGAWGAGINVKKGALVRRGRDNEDWFLAEKDMLLEMEFEDSYMEVYTPGKAELDVYEAYGD